MAFKNLELAIKHNMSAIAGGDVKQVVTHKKLCLNCSNKQLTTKWVNKIHSTQSCLKLQCDQIGWFIVLWATFQRLWQQLFCPYRVTFLGNFCKCVKMFGQLFLNILVTFYWSHCLKASSSGHTV